MSDSHSRWILWIVFAAYVAVVALGALVHEPWWDEAQAWLLARDAPLSDLLGFHLAFEGHPPLWYLILAIPAKAGLPYGAMKVTAILIAAAGVALLLFGLRGVPLLIRILVPFSFYCAYQYTVVARSYVLVPPILYAIAAIYDQRARRFPLFVLLLLALANISIHGLAAAGGLFLLFLIDLARRRIALADVSHRFVGIAALALNAAFLIVMLWPPLNLRTGPVVDLSFNARRFAEVGSWILREMFWGGLEQFSDGVAVAILAVIVAAFAVVLVHLRRQSALGIYLVLTGAMLPVAAMYFGLWHEGLFFFALLFALLVAWQRGGSPRPRWRSLEGAAVIIVIVVLLRHIEWTARSLKYDIESPFTGSRAAAELIQRNGIDRTRLFGAGLRCVELQPYFERNVLANYRIESNAAFWDWSTENRWPLSAPGGANEADMLRFFRQTIAARPDYIIAALGFRADHLYALALSRRPDYRLVATFEGAMYWKSRPTEVIAFQLFQRVR